LYEISDTWRGGFVIDIAVPRDTQSDTLRNRLRGATASAHDMLDHTMRAAAGWTTQDDYADFLKIQHSAREPVEAWLAQHAPESLRPPAQCPLLAQDLASLGQVTSEAAPAFVPPREEASEAQALGIAWVLAGSALGNRSILKEVARIASKDGDEAAQSSKGKGEWPHAFLADDNMLSFWKYLRREIERPAQAGEAKAAARAASSVFDHFLTAARASAARASAAPRP